MGNIYRRSQERYAATKARGEYSKRKYSPDGVTKMTPQIYETMLAAQEGKCSICDEPEGLFIDHCHKSGRVRALLCIRCNHGLGQFKDRPEILRKAADYLERHTTDITY